MTIKEIKGNLLGRIQGYVDSVQHLLEEDKKNSYYESERYDQGALNAYLNVMAMIEDISSEDAEPLLLAEGERYRCLQDLHFEDSDGLMFTKGNTYVVIRDEYGRIGLMDNYGAVRGYNSTGTLVITTEYFQRKED